MWNGDPRALAFAEAIARHLARRPPYVQLVPEFEPHVVAFRKQTPDRVLCGPEAFAAMRRRGFEVAPPLTADQSLAALAAIAGGAKP